MIAIIDYGMGNVGSIRNMLRKLGHECAVTDDPHLIRTSERMILPGVGAFDAGMRNLRERGLEPVLQDAVARGVPLLGICLGMQLLTRGSEEGRDRGLGFLAADTRRFSFSGADAGWRIPHMGWNTVRPVRAQPLFAGLEQQNRFYFVHSYHVVCDNPADVVGLTDYGSPFVSAAAVGSVHGVQFHPEKSHRFGMQLLRNFIDR